MKFGPCYTKHLAALSVFQMSWLRCTLGTFCREHMHNVDVTVQGALCRVLIEEQKTQVVGTCVQAEW